MSLRFCECHPNALKILSTSKLLEYPLEIERLKTKCNKGDVEPILVIDSKTHFFSSNAACRYLCLKSNAKINEVFEHWLEWESSVFQPHVFTFLQNHKISNSFLGLKHCFEFLDAVLQQQELLLQSGAISVIDVAIWCNLFHLMSHANPKVSKYTNMIKWYEKMNQHEALQYAVAQIYDATNKTSLPHLDALLKPAKFFLPVSLPGFEFEMANSVVDNIAVDGDSVVCSNEKECTKEEAEKAYKIWLNGTLPELRNLEPIKLPKHGEKNYLITSALPYVNNVPHLGNIIGSVLSADVFARYCRLRNYNTLYICGTDEYGTATETKAIELGLTPKEICDKFNQIHREIYSWFNIAFDYFGRTTTEQQTKIAQDIFWKLHINNCLIEDTVEQLYCETCQRFLADRFVEGTCPFCLYEDARGDQCDKCGKLINAPELKGAHCKVCKSSPHLRTSKHLFLDLPKMEPELKNYLDEVTEKGQWSNTAKVITYSWLKEGLKPRCITRDLKWGTPVPLEGFTDKVFYVWYDAPIGYPSITANYTPEWEQWWKQPNLVQLYQFMAKDNVPFHSIIFPACQIGTKDNYTIVRNLVATEYLNYEDVKFSKSRGVGVFGDDAKHTGIPSDIWRFYLLYLRPESQDTYFSWNDLMLKSNCELLNNLGNFINRALMFISNNFGGVIPEMNLCENSKSLLAQITQELALYISCMEKARLRDAIKPMLNISRLGNQFIQSTKPWVLIKSSAANKCTAGSVLGLSANIACLLCTLMEPYMPETAGKLKQQLNSKPELHVLTHDFVCLLPSGHKLGKPEPLFQKIDQNLINELKVKFAGRQSQEKEVKVPVKSQNNVAGENLKEIESLSSLVTEQGLKVRTLKSNQAPKSEIDQEVSILLGLKAKLAVLKGEDIVPKKGKSKSKKGTP